MKILLINSLYYPNIVGGAEKSVQLLAESLLARGHEPIVVSSATLASTDTVNGIQVHYLKVPNFYSVMKAGEQPSAVKPLWHLVDAFNLLVEPEFRRIIADRSPDLIHTHNLAGLSVTAWRAAHSLHRPIVHTIRDHYLLCPRTEMYRKGRPCPRQCTICRLYSIPKKIASMRVNAVTGVGRYILDQHLDYGYFRNAQLRTPIYNPVELPSARSTREYRGGDVTFGYVGLLVQGKGIEFLLERFAGMDLPGAKLKVYGRGVTDAYERSLTDRFAVDRIRFEGRREPDEIYDSIDVAIVPSLRHEAFGRIVPEANSYGRPVIVSNRGALPEIVTQGTNGFVFDPDKPGDLERCVRQFVDSPDLLSDMKDGCRKAANHYDREKIVDQYIAVYQEVLS